MSPAPSTARAPSPSRRSSSRAGLFHISIDPQDALEEYLRDQLPPGGVAQVLIRSKVFSDDRGGDARHARAADGRQALGARPARPPHPRRRRLRPRRRRRAGDRPRRRRAQRAAHVRRAAGSGPIARQGRIIDAMLSDPEQIAVVAVAKAEELAVTETGALRTALKDRMGLADRARRGEHARSRPLQPARGDAAAARTPRIRPSPARCAATGARCASARSSRACASSPARRRRICSCSPAARTSSGSPTSWRAQL